MGITDGVAVGTAVGEAVGVTVGVGAKVLQDANVATSNARITVLMFIFIRSLLCGTLV